MDTIELKIDINPKDPWSEILIAEFAELGFDGFVDSDNGFLAYGNATIDITDVIEKTSLSSNKSFEYQLSQQIIPQQNWNAEWESNFNPVYVEDYATILAPFHDNADIKGLKVVIQPQMSFGTGHHQTTWMMTKALFELNEMPHKVLDMGSGTGVLAICAEKLGAEEVLGIDIEDWSVENAIENAERNECVKCRFECGDVDLLEGKQFGLIVANINKNILKSHMESYAVSLKKNGVLLLSGFFGTDVDELVECAESYGLKKERVLSKDEWAGLQLSKL